LFSDFECAMVALCCICCCLLLALDCAFLMSLIHSMMVACAPAASFLFFFFSPPVWRGRSPGLTLPIWRCLDARLKLAFHLHSSETGGRRRRRRPPSALSASKVHVYGGIFRESMYSSSASGARARHTVSGGGLTRAPVEGRRDRRGPFSKQSAGEPLHAQALLHTGWRHCQIWILIGRHREQCCSCAA